MGEFFVSLLIGLAGGFAGGLLGIGGGTIYVPALVILLEEEQHVAQGASLAAIVATGLVGGLTHMRQRNVNLAVAAQVTPVAVVAGFGAAFVANELHAETLQRIFAVVIVYLAGTMIVGALRRQPAVAAQGGD